MNERLLIQGCKEKDPKSQRTLFDRYYPILYRLVRRYMGNHHDTEDVLIVVFNKILKNIQRFEYQGERSLQKWMNTIAINESIRAIQRTHRLVFKEDMAAFEMATPHWEDDPISVRQIHQILAKMPLGYRTVFNLYAMEEYSHREIAEKLNISRNTSKSQLLKARKFIIQELKKETVYEK